MDESAASAVAQGSVEPPRGAFELHLDEKGRLKLPAAYQRYLDAIGDKLVFITTLNRKVARIYPMSAWRKNEEFFRSFKADPKARENVAMWAQFLGGESDIDSSGRVVLPARLREALGFSPKGSVWLLPDNEAFHLFTDAAFQEKLGVGTATLDDNVETLQANGLI